MKSKSLPAIEFTRRLITSGSISAKGILLLFVYYIKLILVMPVTFLQYIFYAQRIKRTVITKQPIFILGHYRSGTTYLHKLMAGDTRFGFISYYDIICPNTSLLFGNWLKSLLQLIINKLRIKTLFFNNTVPSMDDPAEEERFLVNKGSAYTDYWRFVFPLCWNKFPSCAKECLDEAYYQQWSKEYENVLKLATYKSKGKQLVLKSPPNTERIKYLLKMFPDAKFIYISRNPYHVFYSMQNLWNKAIKKFNLQQITDEEIEFFNCLVPQLLHRIRYMIRDAAYVSKFCIGEHFQQVLNPLSLG
ncbi:MAG TPA: sulfotransferase, partial [Panacibacter sp.]|nr:sulfotransferase [Panacibacter sp.]